MTRLRIFLSSHMGISLSKLFLSALNLTLIGLGQAQPVPYDEAAGEASYRGWACPHRRELKKKREEKRRRNRRWQAVSWYSDKKALKRYQEERHAICHP
jgi:hypothetical protein